MDTLSEPLVTVTAPGSRMAEADQPVRLRDLENETQLVLTDRSAITQGTDYGVQAKNIWRLAELSAKHGFLRAGLGWGHMPLWLVADDVAAGKLIAIT
jgi:DNA-binding transcriptional LysR family regulator